MSSISVAMTPVTDEIFFKWLPILTDSESRILFTKDICQKTGLETETVNIDLESLRKKGLIVVCVDSDAESN